MKTTTIQGERYRRMVQPLLCTIPSEPAPILSILYAFLPTLLFPTRYLFTSEPSIKESNAMWLKRFLLNFSHVHSDIPHIPSDLTPFLSNLIAVLPSTSTVPLVSFIFSFIEVRETPWDLLRLYNELQIYQTK